MDHEVGVSVLDRRQHLTKDVHAGGDAHASGVAPGGDRLALNVLERQPGLAARGHAGVVQTGDVRVMQRGEDVALALETGGEALPLLPGRMVEEKLDRYLAREGSIGALGEPDLGHAAGADRTNESIGADAASLDPRGCRRGLEEEARRRFEESIGGDTVTGGEHALELAEQTVFLLPQASEEGREPRCVEHVGPLVQTGEFLPVDDRIPDHGLGG